MEESSRSPVLTTFAILFLILAVSNFLKPFHLDPNAGFVFFGTKTTGVATAVLGPAFGVLLVVYAIGIWQMRRRVLPLAYAYAAYVILNLSLYSIRNAGSPRQSSPAFMIVYIVVAIGVATGSAILLRRRQADLV